MISAVVNGKIYVIAGIQNNSDENQIYDPISDSWSTGAVLPTPQASMIGAYVNGRKFMRLAEQMAVIIIIKFTILGAKNLAKMGPALPIGRSTVMAGAVVNGKIYVIGGVNSTQNNTQIFSPQVNLYYYTVN